MPNEPPANPSDSSYIPRPEWYFLWAFQLLKYFPGQLEGIAIVGLGLVIFVGLFGLPFFDRGPKRHPRNRPIATVVMILIVAGMVFLTIQAVVTTPHRGGGARSWAATWPSRSRREASSSPEYCAECHGADGEGGEIKNQPGEFTRPLNSEDFLITHSDDTIFQIISYGQPVGMPAFGLAYGGALNDPGDPGDRGLHAGPGTCRRRKRPQPATQALADLAKIENPSFAKDVKPILDKKLPQAATASASRAATASTTTTRS